VRPGPGHAGHASHQGRVAGPWGACVKVLVFSSCVCVCVCVFFLCAPCEPRAFVRRRVRSRRASPLYLFQFGACPPVCLLVVRATDSQGTGAAPMRSRASGASGS